MYICDATQYSMKSVFYKWEKDYEEKLRLYAVHLEP